MALVELWHPKLKETITVTEQQAVHLMADPPAGGGWKLATKKQAAKEVDDGES